MSLVRAEVAEDSASSGSDSSEDVPPGFADVTPVRRSSSRDACALGAVPRNLTRLFVRGVPAAASLDELKAAFSQFGPVVSVKIPASRRESLEPLPKIAFIQFTNAAQADWAKSVMDGAQLRDRNGDVFEGASLMIDFS